MPGGGYRYYRDAELGPAYGQSMDALFHTYAAALPAVAAWAEGQFPRAEDESPKAHARAIRAKALDLLRGLLPAASLSHMGIFATGQTYEQLILHLLAHPLPEARAYGRMILDEVKAIMPSFVARVERADRGGDWVSYLEQREAATRRWVARVGLDRDDEPVQGPSVRLLRVDGTQEEMMAALLFEAADVPEERAVDAIQRMSGMELEALWEDLVGDRRNRRYRPGRGLETLHYRFEIVSDYGAFRDLQRHRMLTVQWQELGADHGYAIPAEVEAMGCARQWRGAVERAEEVCAAMRADLPQQASYLITLGHRLRYVMRMNAREALHVIELRTSPQGHPSYRAVCQEMLRLIGDVAGHHRLAGAMGFAGREDVHLPRYVAEAARG